MNSRQYHKAKLTLYSGEEIHRMQRRPEGRSVSAEGRLSTIAKSACRAADTGRWPARLDRNRYRTKAGIAEARCASPAKADR
jgi:hypothetical protein